MCSKTFVKRPLSKRPKIGFQDQLLLNAGQKYCRMPQGGGAFAILSTFMKLPFVIKIIVLSIFEWPFYTGFTLLYNMETNHFCKFDPLFLTISQISHNYNAVPVFSGLVTHNMLRLGINMNK